MKRYSAEEKSEILKKAESLGNINLEDMHCSVLCLILFFRDTLLIFQMILV